MNMDSKLKQTQSIAPEDHYEEEDQDEIVNDNIATLEKEDATPENITPPQQANPMPAPAAPRKERKATTAKGKQPLKKQKLQFNDEDAEDNGDDSSSSSSSSTSLDKKLIFFSLIFSSYHVVRIISPRKTLKVNSQQNNFIFFFL